MSIERFIQNDVLLPRLKEHGLLVVYDPALRYRQLCLGLATETRRVVDATVGSIESREQALATLQALGRPSAGLDGLLVYVPAKRPITDEEKQRDPFALYGACGGFFPHGDGDEFESLCLKAKPDHATEIRRIFGDDPAPSFDVINAVGAGAGWPNLQALLKVESARDILFALLAPSEAQQKALKGNEGWLAEAKELFRACLGLKLLTRGKSWASVADELWRFVLFSEFVFDLRTPLPAALLPVFQLQCLDAAEFDRVMRDPPTPAARTHPATLHLFPRRIVAMLRRGGQAE